MIKEMKKIKRLPYPKSRLIRMLRIDLIAIDELLGEAKNSTVEGDYASIDYQLGLENNRPVIISEREKQHIKRLKWIIEDVLKLWEPLPRVGKY